jgi:carboxyl-terminal processing protease
MHILPAEERETGVARQWLEYVLPRKGKHYDGDVTVRVGRWTGSMGEGLAIGMQALGAKLEGNEMAGLLGAIYDLRLEAGLLFKIPVERLESVGGTPRENVVISPPE